MAIRGFIRGCFDLLLQKMTGEIGSVGRACHLRPPAWGIIFDRVERKGFRKRDAFTEDIAWQNFQAISRLRLPILPIFGDHLCQFIGIGEMPAVFSLRSEVIWI
jgi:hypothetical protein